VAQVEVEAPLLVVEQQIKVMLAGVDLVILEVAVVAQERLAILTGNLMVEMDWPQLLPVPLSLVAVVALVVFLLEVAQQELELAAEMEAAEIATMEGHRLPLEQ